MKRRCVYFFSLLCVALLVGGCRYFGRGGDIVASKFVTKADAEKILGVPVRLDSEKNSEKESTCLYVDAVNSQAHILQATFQVAASEEEIKAAEEIAKSVTAKYGTIEAVDGIGEGAWLVKREGGRTIHVRKKKIAFLIGTMWGHNKELSLDELKRVAKRVADEL